MKILKFDTKYNLNNAIFLAKLSKEIYTHNQIGVNIEENLKNKFKFDDAIFESISSIVNGIKIDLQFSILKNENDIVVVFKGSKELDDWSTNIKIKEEKLLNTDVHIHLGFGNSLQLFLDTIKSSTKELDGIKLQKIYNDLTVKDSQYNLFITGHSLGGAIATLFTAHLQNTHASQENVVCYTYGAPPVGWKDFYDKYKDINLFRIVNKFDPVPNVNRLSKNISTKFISTASAWKSLRHVGELIELPSDEYEHHSASHYIKNLNKEGKNTLKRNTLVDVKQLALKYKWTAFLVVLAVSIIGLGFIGYVKAGYSVVDSIYASLKILALNMEIKQNLNWELETSRFFGLIFVFSAILKAIFFFFDRTLIKPFKLARYSNHTVIFGFNGHVQELVKSINKENIQTKVVIVASHEINSAQIGLKAQTVLLPEQLSVKFMQMLALENAKHIICINMDDNIDITHANGIIEYLDIRENVEHINLHVHLHSYTLPDLFNHENYMALLGKMPCNIKVFNHYDNAVRVLFRNTVMEDFLNGKTTHWLITGEWNQKIAFMRYVAQIAYYEDEKSPYISLVCENVEESQREIKKLFPQIYQAVTIKIIDTIDATFEKPVTHIAVLHENDVKGLEEALLINNLFKDEPVFLQQRTDSIITNEQIIPFGMFSTLNKTSVVIDEALDERAKNIHNYYRSLYTMEPWEELPLFKKNSNRMQAEHISIKLRGIGWKNEDDFTGYKEFLGKNSELVKKWMRIEHLRWNAFHYVNGWDHSEKRNDAKKLHHCLVAFDKLTKADQKKDEPALLEIPTFLKDVGEEGMQV